MNKWCSSCHQHYHVSHSEDHCPDPSCFGFLYGPKEKMYMKAVGGIVIKGNPVTRQLEHFATPLWKIIGAKPNAQEAHEEKLRKAKGYTHLQMQQERLSKAKRTYNTDRQKKALFRGELKGKPAATYGKVQT